MKYLSFIIIFLSFSNICFGQLKDKSTKSKVEFKLVNKAYFEKNSFNLTPSNQVLGNLLSNNEAQSKNQFDPSYNKYLNSGSKKYRFNINFSPIAPYNYFNSCPQNLSLVSNGYNPYYNGPTEIPSFTESVFIGVISGFLRNL